MPDVLKTYKQLLPALRFIGKKYGDADRVNGGFGEQWGQWFAHGWFNELEKLCPPGFYEDANAYIGLMRCRQGEPFAYWVGMFLPEGTAVPNGYGMVDFPASALGVTWLYGPQGSLFGQEELAYQSCVSAGYQVKNDEQGARWFFERYGCPRFTTPDEKGNVILDVCFFLED